MENYQNVGQVKAQPRFYSFYFSAKVQSVQSLISATQIVTDHLKASATGMFSIWKIILMNISRNGYGLSS